MLRWLAACAVAALMLAGCSGPDAPQTAADNPLASGGDAASLQAAFDPAASYAAPEWQVGQWWEWEISFGTTVADETFCSIVLATDGSSYAVATESVGMAKDDAAFDHPLLGTIGKAALAMQGYGGDPEWSLLAFPLTDGKTWTATVPNIAWDVVPAETADLAMTATADPGLYDGVGGFRVVGVSGEHRLVEADYVPSIGWFSGVRFFDTDPGEEGLEVGYRAKSVGTDYAGPYFQATATQLVDLFDGSGFTDVPTEGGQPFADPHTYTDFLMEGGEGHLLYGYIVAETVVAARAVVLVDPNNQERHFESHNADLDGSGTGLFIDEPAVAGMWRLATGGVGGFSVTVAELFEVVVTEGAL